MVVIDAVPVLIPVPVMTIMEILMLVQNIITVIAIGTTIAPSFIIIVLITAGTKTAARRPTVSVIGKADLISMGKE